MRSKIYVLTLLAATGCFRKEKKGETVLAEAEESIGPRAFSLNQPVAPVKGEPVVLSWTPSKDATFYEARVGTQDGCADRAVEQLGLLTPELAASGLAEGQYRLCVVAKDDQGRTKVADNDGVTFTIDRTAPAAEIAKVPDLLDREITLTVTGDGVTAYSYKVGPTAQVDCAKAKDYSNTLPQAAPLKFTVDPAETTPYTLCLLGEDDAGNRQTPAEASVFQWEADGIGRRFLTDLGAAVGENSPSDLMTLRITGNARAGWTGVQGASISLKSSATGLCFDSKQQTFSRPCPAYFKATGGGTWTVDVPKKALVEFNRYDLSMRGVDAKGKTIEAGKDHFHWRFAHAAVRGEGQRHLIQWVRGTDGAEASLFQLEGGLDAGEIKLKKPEAGVETKRDWAVVKRSPSGGTLWAKRLGGSAEDIPRQLVLNTQGDVFVIGHSEGDFTTDKGTLEHQGKADVVVLKLAAATGATVWQRHLASTDHDQPGGIALNQDGDPVVFLSACEAIDFGDGNPSPAAGCPLFLATYAAATGALKQLRTFEANGYTEPESFFLAPDGSAYLAGSYNGHIKFGASTINATNDRSGYLVKLTAAGELAWEAPLECAADPKMQGVTRHADGQIYALGHVSGAGCTLKGVATGSAAGIRSLIMARLDANGTPTWIRAAATGSSQDVGAFDVIADAVGDAYFSAKVIGSVTFDGKAHQTKGEADLLFAKLRAADGKALLVRTLGSTAYDVYGRTMFSRSANGHILFSYSYWYQHFLGDHQLDWAGGLTGVELEYAR